MKDTTMNDKLKDKLLKLYELSKRGVDGEKINAEFFLNKMLNKHNLTIDDINQEIPKKRYYPYTNLLKKKIILQVIYKVSNNKNIYTLQSYKEVFCEITDYHHIQILELIDFHINNFEEERKQFLKEFTNAYIQKHRLFGEPDNENPEPKKPLTTEEKQSIWRMSNIKECLSNKSYTKKLT